MGQFANGYLLNGFPQGTSGSANGWAGVPLISTATRRPGRKSMPAFTSQAEMKDFDETAMSKLAIHAHGAPLILTGGRYNNRGNNPNKGHNVTTFPRRHMENGKFPKMMGQNSKMDKYNNHSLDDNGAGMGQNCTGMPGAGLDTCLPRIIKPRKRRKKDRKPMAGSLDAVGQVIKSEGNLIESNDDNVMFHKTRDDENELTSCSCRICDPFSHIWAFPLRSCSMENNNNNLISSNVSSGSNGDLGLMSTGDLLNHKQQKQKQIKDVGVIGGNRSNQQKRSEWRASPPQLQQQSLDKCDNVFLHEIGSSGSKVMDKNNNNINNHSNGDRFGLITSGHNNHMFGARPGMMAGNVQDSDDDDESADSGCDLLGGIDMMLDRVVLASDVNSGNMLVNGVSDNDDEEAILIKNLANLLSVGPSSNMLNHRNAMNLMNGVSGAGHRGDPFSESSNLSDSSGVSSASDTASVFSDCYSPIINFNGFPFHYNLSPPNFSHHHQQHHQSELQQISHHNPQISQQEGEESKPLYFVADKDREQEVLNCMDMVWNRPPSSSTSSSMHPNQLLLPFK